MAKEAAYRGVFPALYACYDEKGRVCPARTRAAVRFLQDQGVQGVYAGGSSGECIYLDVAERKTMLEAVMAEAADGFSVIAHVACNNTRDSVELAAHAQALSVRAIASIPPIYFKLSEAAIASYWDSISQAAPQTDFMIYNIPQLAGVALTPTLFQKMLANERVVALKNSSLLVGDIALFKELGGPGFSVLNGPDEQYLAGRSMGASGGIGGTYLIMPMLFLKLEELIRRRELDQAGKLQAAIIRIIDLTASCHGHMLAVNKEILRRLYGLDLGQARAPLPELVEADLPVIDKCLHLLEETISFWENK